MAQAPIKLDPYTLSVLTRDLAMIQNLPARSGTKTVEMHAIVQTLKRFNFIEFSANNGHILYRGQVGKYAIGYISKGKRGHLRPFQNQQVIVVCVGSGINRTRKYMAGSI